MSLFSKTLSSSKFFSTLAINGVILGAGTAAHAELQVCNDTSEVQSISIGYEGAEAWTSEGWWNVNPNECSTVIGGDLDARYFYLRAEVQAGEFEGEGYYFCTSPSEYTIVGDTDCDARGYDREDFIEIDAGQNVSSYTHRLTDANTTALQTAVARGLIFCNETANEQSISVGYEGAEGWTSEGWWNIAPSECKTPIGTLDKEYYYFRAEVDGGSFDGDGYSFCTTPEAYTIVGDQNCEARGYETEDFREVNVGKDNTVFTYTLVDAGAEDGADAGPVVPSQNPSPNETVTDLVGLEFCNITQDTQSVSIGYEGDEGFTSEGWWNIEPTECGTVIATELTKQYYYYRFEVNGGEFTGDNAFFCTQPSAYTIVGDQNCEARGYDSEDFAELDVGLGSTGYSFTIRGDAGAAATVAPDPAPADTPAPDGGFQVCNETAGTQGFSIGYKGEEDWTSEGWWNVEPGDCATVIAGELTEQYYYLRAELDGGDFAGEDYFFCTTPDAYTIVGDQNCEARGYDRESFIEVDIGFGSTAYSYTLVDDDSASAAPDTAVDTVADTGRGDVADSVSEAPATVVDNISDVGTGLEFCNDTSDTQSISVGYEGAEGWTSEGWWNIDPGDCTMPGLDGKNRRYFYYRAEVDGGDFDGENYFFCTQPEAYTIVGDTGCTERGYDNEDFREIDTGSETGIFTFTLTSAAGAPAVDPAPGIAPEAPAVTPLGGGAEFDRSGAPVQEAPDGAVDPATQPAEPVVDPTPEPEPEPTPEPEPAPEPEPTATPEPEPEPTGGGRRGGSRG